MKEIRKNQKVNKIDNDELIVKNYPKKKQSFQQQPKFKPPDFFSCKQNNWLDFDKGYYSETCKCIINKQKHQLDNEVRKQDQNFSNRLPYVDKRIREKWMNMANTKHNSTEKMISKLQQLKGKT